MRRWMLATTLMLAACGQAGSDNHADMIDGPGNAAGLAAPLAAVPPTSLAAWQGKYPSDKVDGAAFFDQPRVRDAIRRAVGEGQPVTADQLLALEGPETPIRMDGDMVTAWRCEQHNCGPHNWSLRISADAGQAQVCYHDDDATPQNLWFEGGKRIERTEECQPAA